MCDQKLSKAAALNIALSPSSVSLRECFNFLIADNWWCGIVHVSHIVKLQNRIAWVGGSCNVVISGSIILGGLVALCVSLSVSHMHISLLSKLLYKPTRLYCDDWLVVHHSRHRVRLLINISWCVHREVVAGGFSAACL